MSSPPMPRLVYSATAEDIMGSDLHVSKSKGVPCSSE